VAVSVEGAVRLQLPIHTISGIVCFGNVAMSPFLMGFCADNNVTITFLTEYGKFLARVHGKTHGNVLLRREQYRKADDLIFCARLSRNFIIGKVANARTVLQRALRDHSDKICSKDVEFAVSRLGSILSMLGNECDLETLRGIEGDAAKIYFDVFDHLILNQKESFVFEQRNRRPPRDNVNCLLSFLYTLLAHDVRSALEGVGLDSYVGFMHRDRPGRPSLALDVMEEFRPFFTDRLLLSLVNRGQVSPKGFQKSESGAVLMTDETRKDLLTAYQARKQEEIMHPFLKENVKIGILFHVQAMMLARLLRGDIDDYPPFLWR